MSFFDVPVEHTNYEIFETDYDNYVMIYDCNEEENFLYFYILSRTPQMDPELYDYCVERAHEVIPNYNFDNMYHVVHDDRCVYPEPFMFSQ